MIIMKYISETVPIKIVVIVYYKQAAGPHPISNVLITELTRKTSSV